MSTKKIFFFRNYRLLGFNPVCVMGLCVFSLALDPVVYWKYSINGYIERKGLRRPILPGVVGSGKGEMIYRPGRDKTRGIKQEG